MSDSATTPLSTSANGAYSTATGRWSLVSLIMGGMVFSLIDRQIIALLVEPSKADLNLTDTQFSILIGPAFVIAYLVFGFPFGLLADRIQRRHVIAFGITVWSAATVMCGMAWSFLSLAVARAVVGAGEASLMPSSMSILSGLFTRERLPFVTAIFSVSMHIGGASAMLVGGLILGIFGDTEFISIPLFGDVRPWQLAFIVVGLPGLLLAAVFMLIPEPPRSAATTGSLSPAPEPEPEPTSELMSDPSVERPVGPSLTQFLSNNAVTIGGQYGAAALLTISTNAFVSWSPAFLIRGYGLSSEEAALVLGIIMLTCGPTGTIAGGALSGWLLKTKGRVDAPWLVMILSAAGSGLFGLFAFTVGVPVLAYLLLAMAIFMGSLYLGIIHAALQVITPDHLRGRVAALMLIMMTGVGGATGPVIVALLTDYLFGGPEMVGLSVAVVAMAVGVAVTILLGLNLSAYRTSYHANEMAIQSAQDARKA